ncbi:MAG: chlorite dismutase family protein [Myxococcales bacterium]|nr:chlorite dismutase family protein [Myxococcales bacterium]
MGSHDPSEAPPSRVATGEPIDLSVDVIERGAERNGEPQAMDRRLFMQLQVYICGSNRAPDEVTAALGAAFRKADVRAVLYADLSDPRSVGILTWSEDPAHFTTRVRSILGDKAFADLTLRPDFTMTGRTYSTGYESDLEYWLLRRPEETALHEQWPWAVWYPLRRGGAFEQLAPREQGQILKEHGIIGRAYGAKDLAHDIRLACHGLDTHDNDFVIGLIGKELHPLSHVVQRMRKTRQTREFLTHLGPFFIGHVLDRIS